MGVYSIDDGPWTETTLLEPINIESTVGEGTVATIILPKNGQKDTSETGQA